MDLTAIVDILEKVSVVATATIAFATTVVAITPTKKDDAILDKIVTILEYFSLVNKKTKE